MLRTLQWRHSRGRNPPETWFTTLADAPRPGAIRPEIREIAAAVTAGLLLMVFGLTQANDAGWASAQTIGVLIVSAVLIAVFLVIEARNRHALMPLGFFRRRTPTGANIVGVLLGASLFSMFFFISLYMQQVLGYSAIHAGLSYLPLAVTIIVAAGIGGGFAPPGGACTTYRATHANLAEFEADLHRHVHLENNVLFPRALALDGELRSRRAGGPNASVSTDDAVA